MEYIASISYGKDSLAMLEIIKEHNLPLDRIIHVDVWATDTIPADLPLMTKFKTKADIVIKELYGVDVEHIRAKFTYQDVFYKKLSSGGKSKFSGKIYGFPMLRGSWCNSALKMSALKCFDKPDIVQYIGIASDEPKRFKKLNDNKVSPLVQFGITERECFEICEKLDLLSPIYNSTARGGCWFCHYQTVEQLRYLRKFYPDLWELLLKWDSDSPSSFKPDGHTVHDFDYRFMLEDKGYISTKKFYWNCVNVDQLCF